MLFGRMMGAELSIHFCLIVGLERLPGKGDNSEWVLVVRVEGLEEDV